MVNPLTLPAGANPETDQIVGFDELGAPLRVTSRGVRYLVSYPAQQPAPRVPSVLETVVDPFTGRATHEQQPLTPTSSGAALQGILDAVTQGITAPGRAARGQEPTLGDVWSTALDWGAMSAPMRAPAGAIRSGAMGSQSAADEIASMLREGRASEVTDPMMAALTPQDNMRLFQLYEEGATGQPMPMDEASRMARAREMGFDTDTPLYHGTTAEFQGFTPSETGKFGAGVYTSQQPSMAERYMEMRESPGQNVMPVFNSGERLRLDSDFSEDQARRLRLPRRVRSPDDLWPSGVTAEQFYADLDARSARGGYTAREYGSPYMEVVTQDPRNIRSRFARFDPRLSHLSNLSAAAAPAGVGYGLLSGQDEEIRQYLGLLGGM